MSRHRTRQDELRVGLLLLAAVGVFAWMSIRIGGVAGLGETIKVRAVFDDAAGLVDDSAVKIAGVEVGRVQGLVLDGTEAAVFIALQKSAGVRSDVRAQVRARSLLGEKYVALSPQGSEAPFLEEGGLIQDTIPSVEIDDLVTMLGPVLSQVDPADVAELVEAAGKLSAEVSASGPELVQASKTLLEQLNAAAETAPAIKKEVPELLERTGKISRDLERLLGRAESTLSRFDLLVRRADELVGTLDEAATDVPAAVADARGLMAELKPGMDDLSRALTQSDDVVTDLRKVLDNLEEFDEATVKRLLREEGVLVRLKAPPKKK